MTTTDTTTLIGPAALEEAAYWAATAEVHAHNAQQAEGTEAEPAHMRRALMCAALSRAHAAVAQVAMAAERSHNARQIDLGWREVLAK